MKMRNILNLVNSAKEDAEEFLDEVQEEILKRKEEAYPLRFRRNGKDLVREF